MSTHDLSGQVAVVTGGGRGLGRSFAIALASAGAKVAVISRTKSEVEETAALISNAGGTSRAYVADALDRAAAARIVADIQDRLGQIDTLVNNAAILGALGLEWDVDEEEWWEVVTVNLRGRTTGYGQSSP